MDATFTEYRTQLVAMGERTLSAQKTVADWQLDQLKLAEKQMTDWMALSRASVDASQQAWHGMAKTMLHAMAPAKA